MIAKLKPGAIAYLIPILVIALSVFTFVYVKKQTIASFNTYQGEVETAFSDRLDPFSSKYSLSHQMGDIDTWITFANQRFNYKITHPRYWNKLQSKEYPGAEDLYEAALSSRVKISVIVQKNFTEAKKAEKFKTLEGEFVFFENTPETKAAYIKNNDFYYIISLQESDYFGSESEFKGTFFNVIKRFEFLD